MNSRKIAEQISPHATILTGASDDYDELMLMAKKSRFVLIGEASHGTHEFYQIRAEITKRLISEEDFTAVAVEADWPDAYRVNRYVQGDTTLDNAEDALADFKRFPTWMWCNTEVRNFIDWLYDYNHATEGEAASVGFYGLDLYSLNRSSQAVIDYLETIDPKAALRARQRYGCFDAYNNNPETYAAATEIGVDAGCEKEIIEQLIELQQKTYDYLEPGDAEAKEAFFSAEQNARLIANAERYYRAMFRGRPSSWNIRDTHMADTLESLAGHLTEKWGKESKIVVWAHNSHIGDARATDAGQRGEINIGQLIRERYPDETLLIGFTTYNGSVTAAANWDEPEQRKTVKNALAGSVEAIFHHTKMKNFILNLKSNKVVRSLLSVPLLSRFIGVIYRPDTERWSHYYHVQLADEFDAVIHLDKTTALEPLTPQPTWQDVPHALEETYPTGL